jgi:hypothetical protein
VKNLRSFDRRWQWRPEADGGERIEPDEHAIEWSLKTRKSNLVRHSTPSHELQQQWEPAAANTRSRQRTSGEPTGTWAAGREAKWNWAWKNGWRQTHPWWEEIDTGDGETWGAQKIIIVREGLQGAALQSEPRKPGGEKSRTGNGFPLQRRKSTKETNKKNQKSRFRPRKRAKQNELRHNHEN